MPYFDQTGPIGQGPTGKGLGGCRSNMHIANRGDTSFSGGLGRRIRSRFDKRQGSGRCGGGQAEGQSRKRGRGRR